MHIDFKSGFFCLKGNGRLFSVFSPLNNQLQPGIVHRGIKNNNNKKTNKQPKKKHRGWVTMNTGSQGVLTQGAC